MKSTSESLSHPETSNGRAVGGNCVVVRRGGEQPEADLRSQTKVNPIRFATAASLLASGQRGRALIIDICSIQGGITKLGRSASVSLALLEWELILQPKPEERREDRQS